MLADLLSDTLTAPTPGWKFTFDQVGPGEGEVYVTVTRPDPALLYPAMIVEATLEWIVREVTGG